MKERPILFSGPMVRAILDGKKTQTRRLVSPQPDGFWDAPNSHADTGLNAVVRDVDGRAKDVWINCPFGRVGDWLWVRETWAKPGEVGDHTEYRADNPDPLAAKWRPSIHMPRRASRLSLEITEVRVERLTQIMDADGKAEGYAGAAAFLAGEWARPLRADNPWVWVIGFRRVDPTASLVQSVLSSPSPRVVSSPENTDA
jgi:hypothetical protein